MADGDNPQLSLGTIIASSEKGLHTEPCSPPPRRRRAQGATLAELARSYGMGKSTISRLA